MRNRRPTLLLPDNLGNEIRGDGVTALIVERSSDAPICEHAVRRRCARERSVAKDAKSARRRRWQTPGCEPLIVHERDRGPHEEDSEVGKNRRTGGRSRGEE